MLTVKVEGLQEMVKALESLKSDRIPNYVARALTETANKVQTAMIEETMRGLTVRGSWIRPGTRYGINRTPATKNNLAAIVSSGAQWLVEQELDPVHEPRLSQHLLVPFPAVRVDRTEIAPIPRRMTPKRMAGKLVKIETKRGPVLFERVKGKSGRGKLARFMSMLVPMWALERKVRIPKRVRVLDVAQRAADEHAEKAIVMAIDAAIREQGLSG